MLLHQLFHVQGARQGCEPLRLAELRRRALLVPIVHRIEMQRIAAQIALQPAIGGLPFFHNRVGPVIIFRQSAGSYFVERIAAIVFEEKGVAGQFIGIKIGRHDAAAAKGLIAHAPEFHLPGFFPPVLFAQSRHRIVAIGG